MVGNAASVTLIAQPFNFFLPIRKIERLLPTIMVSLLKR